MSDDFIDEDLNYDVIIDVKKFKNPNSKAIKSAYSGEVKKFFGSAEEFCNFMVEVGTNHPDGVNLRYLSNLMSYYSTTKALSNLEEKGLITSEINEEGEVVYTLTELGKNITANLD